MEQVAERCEVIHPSSVGYPTVGSCHERGLDLAGALSHHLGGGI